ncbi:MAG: enoyl-CoA hydratase-related protein, partial [Alphaproteobacteria bacterium]
KMAVDVAAAITEATQDPAIKAIIVTGAGRGFCAGADMNNLNSLSKAGGGKGVSQAVGAPDFIANDPDVDPAFKNPVSYFPAVPKPIIAAINGPVAGMGLALALHADIRIAARSAIFTTAFSKRGLIAEHGTSWMLPRLVGQAAALDMLFSSRKVTGEEAAALGLANQCVDDDTLMDSAIAYARMLADQVAPRSIKIMKQQVYAAQQQSFGEAMDLANREMVESLKTDDFKEGVAHFLEKRPPNFPNV